MAIPVSFVAPMIIPPPLALFSVKASPLPARPFPGAIVQVPPRQVKPLITIAVIQVSPVAGSVAADDFPILLLTTLPLLTAALIFTLRLLEMLPGPILLGCPLCTNLTRLSLAPASVNTNQEAIILNATEKLIEVTEEAGIIFVDGCHTIRALDDMRNYGGSGATKINKTRDISIKPVGGGGGGRRNGGPCFGFIDAAATVATRRNPVNKSV